jgi:hypothetical protein
MTGEEWGVIAALIEQWFRGEFDDNREMAYLRLLEPYDAEAVLTAVRELANSGQVFVPAVGEILAALERDVSIPEWPVLWGAIERAVLRFGADERRAVDWLSGGHPLAGSFVRAVGWDALRMADREGPWDEKRFREAWERHLEAGGAVRARRLALEGPRRLGLERGVAGLIGGGS